MAGGCYWIERAGAKEPKHPAMKEGSAPDHRTPAGHSYRV